MEITKSKATFHNETYINPLFLDTIVLDSEQEINSLFLSFVLTGNHPKIFLIVFSM